MVKYSAFHYAIDTEGDRRLFFLKFDMYSKNTASNVEIYKKNV